VSLAEFVALNGPRLRHALVARYGADIGMEVYSSALEYAATHWDRLSEMDNPIGYLFRVGQSAATALRRSRPCALPRPVDELPEFDPALVPALDALPEMQRLVVILVVALQWKQSEVAELTGLSHSTVRTHLSRALSALQKQLKVNANVN